MFLVLDKVRNFAVINKATPVTIDVGQIDIGIKWFKWENKLMMKLENTRSADGIQSCRYLARRPKPVGWNPIIDAIDNKERLMYQVPLSGGIFQIDDAKTWTELKEVTIMSSAWTSV